MTRAAFRRELSRLNRKQRGTTEAVEPLFIYAKNDRANIEPVEIREALRAAGLIGELESN